MEMEYRSESNAEGVQPELLAIVGLIALGGALLAEGRFAILLGIIGLISLAESIARHAEGKCALPFEGCSQEIDWATPALSHPNPSPAPEYSWVAAVEASRQESRYR